MNEKGVQTGLKLERLFKEFLELRRYKTEVAKEKHRNFGEDADIGNFVLIAGIVFLIFGVLVLWGIFT